MEIKYRNYVQVILMVISAIGMLLKYDIITFHIGIEENTFFKKKVYCFNWQFVIRCIFFLIGEQLSY